MKNFGEKANFIWSVADLLRGPYRPNQYKDVMLPMTVLRRLDCVLESTKEDVLTKYSSLKTGPIKNTDIILNKVAGQSFHNISKFTFEKLKGDPDNIAANLINYMKGFSSQAREIIDHFKFEEQIGKLEKADRLFLLVQKFCEIDLHPNSVSNIEMGYIFEDLVRRFNEASNEKAGDHFTPREVIRLMVNLLFLPDKDVLTTKGIVKTLFDPACGTGGMLSVSEDYLREFNRDAQLEVFGQDYNDQAFAICGSDMMIKGQNIEHICFGDSFTNDAFSDQKFDYMLANPPFGVEWKPEEKAVRKEAAEKGFEGRFGAGLPRINDGSLLFLQHMTSKMKERENGGTRIAIVFNGSPLFTGSAGSGESDIRRWIIESDWLEAIVALPDQLFYNTGISTYIWIVTNRKEQKRKGKIQLVNASSKYTKMRKSLGNKRNEISNKQIEEITKLYGNFEEGEDVRIFNNEDLGYRKIVVEQPLRVNYANTLERLQNLYEHTAFTNLASSKKRKDKHAAEFEIREGRKKQKIILETLSKLSLKKPTDNQKHVLMEVKSALKKAGVTSSTSLIKAIMEALSEKDQNAMICVDSKGNKKADPDLRDSETISLKQDLRDYMSQEVHPYLPDAWVDESKTKIGFEINFNKYFYKYKKPRSLTEIEVEMKEIEEEITGLLRAVIS